MADFLEERLIGAIRYGSGYQDDYSVKIITTSDRREFRSLIHPFPVREFDISYLVDSDTLWANLIAVYHRAHGKYAGFRAKCTDEFTSNGRVSAPTAFDQAMGLISAGVYQLRKYYGLDKTAGASGYAYRNIYKPVAGTIKVGVSGVELNAVDYTASTTNGRVTFPANVTAAISAISLAAQAVVTIGTHSLAIGRSVRVSGITTGMPQMNNLRGRIVSVTSTTITLDINSSAFGAYVSGGVVNTQPQAGEAVTAGYEFDFPVRFNSTLPIGQDYPGYRAIDGVKLLELLNP